MRGPRPGVKPNANHPKYWSDCILGIEWVAAEITQEAKGMSSGVTTQR